MAIADTITSMQTHTSNAYTMIGYGTDLTGINKNLANLYGTIFEAFLEALRTPDTLFTNLPKKTGSGSNIALNDTAYAPMRIVLNTTETTQASTPTPSSPVEVQTITGRQEVKCVGKNLADISKIAIGKSWSGVTSTQRATILWLPIKANQKYNFVSSWTNSSITNIRVVLNHGSSDQTNNFVVSSSPFTNTTWEYASIEILANTTFTSAMLDGVKIMLCKGEDSEYEPYIEQVNEINLGKNLYEGSQDFSGTWEYGSSWETDSSTFNGCVVKKRAGSWNGINKTFPVVSGKTYTFSVYAKADESRNCGLYLSNSVTPVASTISVTTEWQRYSITFTANSNSTVRPRIENQTNSSTNYTYIACFQLERGTQATSYSEYFTPIELCKIGTYEDKIFKTTGKNLFNYQWFEAFMSDLKFIQVTGLKPNTDYTLSSNIPKKSENENIANLFLSATQSPSTGANGVMPNQPRTINTGSLNYLYVGYRDNAGNLDNEATKYWYMLEESSSATEYEPYGSGEWYVKKNIGKVVLDGSENWNGDGGTQGTDYRHNIYYASRMTIPTALGTNNTYLSNYFTPRNTGSDAGELGSFYMTNGWLVFVDKNKVYDLAQWKTWLGTNMPIVYYVLSTPTYEKLNDTLQQTIESASYGMLSYKGQTNIINDTENLPFTLDVTTIEDLS